MRRFVGQLSARTKAPMLVGADAIEDAGSAHERYFNAAFVVDPELGVQTAFYAKRRLVQFGEYIPLRPLFGWIGKFAPLGRRLHARGRLDSAHRAPEPRGGRVWGADLLRGPFPEARARGGPFGR